MCPLCTKEWWTNFQSLFGWFHEVIFGQFHHLYWFGHPFAQITMMLQKMPRVQDKFQPGEMYLNGIIGDDSRDYRLQKGKLSNPKKQQMK